MQSSSSAAGSVVVGIDGSEPSAAALRWAADEARLRSVGLHVVTCFSYPAIPWGPYQPPIAMEALERDAREGAAKELEEVLGASPDLDVSLEVVQGPASLRLLDFGPIAEMIVVGSRGRGGFAGLLLGSVSQHLAEHATCPVVVVHPAKA